MQGLRRSCGSQWASLLLQSNHFGPGSPGPEKKSGHGLGTSDERAAISAHQPAILIPRTTSLDSKRVASRPRAHQTLIHTRITHILCPSSLSPCRPRERRAGRPRKPPSRLPMSSRSRQPQAQTMKSPPPRPTQHRAPGGSPGPRPNGLSRSPSRRMNPSLHPRPRHPSCRCASRQPAPQSTGMSASRSLCRLHPWFPRATTRTIKTPRGPRTPSKPQATRPSLGMPWTLRWRRASASSLMRAIMTILRRPASPVE